MDRSVSGTAAEYGARHFDCKLLLRNGFTQSRLTAPSVQFGSGHRSCLGKNVAIVEVKKTVSALLRRYEVLHPIAAIVGNVLTR